MTERKKTLQEAYGTEIVAAWREQLAEAAENPWLADLLLRYGDRILGRFIAFHQRLRRLPHKTLWQIRRKLGLSLGSAALLLAMSVFWASVVRADDISVGNGCSLADAIAAANTGTTQGGCSGTTGADTLIISEDITLTAELPTITSTVTISASQHTIKRDPTVGPFRILAVGAGGKLTLNDAIITGGYAAGEAGGGIYGSGALTITGCTVLSNTTDSLGGGVFNCEGTTVIRETVISGNTAQWCGGGVANTGGLTVAASLMLSNTTSSGGGLCNLGYYGAAQAVVINSIISGNVAERDGGGLSNLGYVTGTAHMAITDSVISGNYGDFGGGVFNLGYNGAAGLHVSDTTISRNESYWGGGIENLAIGTNALIGPDGLQESTPSRIESDAIRGAVATGEATRGAIESELGRGGDTGLSAWVIKRRFDLSNVPMVTSSHRGNGAVLGEALSDMDTLDRQALANGKIDSRAEVSIETSVISGNLAFYAGGGVSNYGILTGTAGITISQTTVSSNKAGYGGESPENGLGGGLSNIGLGGGTARLLAEQSTVSENLASTIGGGVFNGGSGYEDEQVCKDGIGLVTFRNTTVSGNAADELGGGGFANWAGSGEVFAGEPCGIGQISIEHTTVSGNEAPMGGGVLNITYNATGLVSLGHSIISGNHADMAANEACEYCYQSEGFEDACGGIVASDYNLFGDASENDNAAFAGTFTPTRTSDIKATSNGRAIPLNRILDSVLRDNGGRTKTHALVFGSPAIDAGDRAFSPPPFYDQRGSGHPRVINGRIDIGAYEYRPVPVGGVTVGRSWFGLLVSRARLLLVGLGATLGAFVAAVRRIRP